MRARVCVCKGGSEGETAGAIGKRQTTRALNCLRKCKKIQNKQRRKRGTSGKKNAEN